MSHHIWHWSAVGRHAAYAITLQNGLPSIIAPSTHAHTHGRSKTGQKSYKKHAHAHTRLWSIKPTIVLLAVYGAHLECAKQHLASHTRCAHTCGPKVPAVVSFSACNECIWGVTLFSGMPCMPTHTGSMHHWTLDAGGI